MTLLLQYINIKEPKSNYCPIPTKTAKQPCFIYKAFKLFIER